MNKFGTLSTDSVLKKEGNTTDINIINDRTKVIKIDNRDAERRV